MLRERARNTLQYGSLKHLHLSGNLVDEADTPAWRVKTPNQGWSCSTFCVTAQSAEDFISRRDPSRYDGELSEERLMSIGDTMLPHIQHWDRLAILLRDKAVAAMCL